MAEIKYLVGGADGWLLVKRDPSGDRVSLPAYLKVELTKNSGGRDYFTVLEGVEQGKKFSVLEKNIRAGDPGYKPPANLEFSLSREILNSSAGSVRAFTDPTNPIQIGKHPIQIPDFPHGAGATYLNQSPFAKSWFYLGVGAAVAYSNDRYLHPGRQSGGCITVNPSDWTVLYRYLILCRSGDGKTVGTVKVVR